MLSSSVFIWSRMRKKTSLGKFSNSQIVACEGGRSLGGGDGERRTEYFLSGVEEGQREEEFDSALGERLARLVMLDKGLDGEGLEGLDSALYLTGAPFRIKEG